MNEKINYSALLKNAIAKQFGFDHKKIELQEAYEQYDEIANEFFFRTVWFKVCGINYKCDMVFGDIEVITD